MKINRTTSSALIPLAATRVSAILEDYIEDDVLLLVADGSSFAVLDFIRPEVLGKHITIAMMDDRFSHDLDINNFHQLQATHFYNECINNGVYIISTEVWLELIPEELAKRFQHGLQAWRNEFPHGKIVAVFGMGEDGHTAGIMPDTDVTQFAERFENKEKIVTGYFAPNNEFHERITITLPFIREINQAIVYVGGEKKRKALDKVLSKKGSLEETPARIFREMKDVEIFTDIKE